MSLAQLINIAGMPGMDVAVSAVSAGPTNSVSLPLQTQCRDLSDRCTKLLLAFREKCEGLEGTEFMGAADEVSIIIDRARRKAASWAAMSRIKSFVNQGDIKLGLEQLYRDIDLCAQQFNIASNAELHRGHRELQILRERDIAENREVLQNILRSVDGLRDVFALNEPNAVHNLMQTIQEELQQQQVLPDQQRDLQQGLYEIHRKTDFLPPMIDLTGQVEKTSKNAVAYGAYNDVFTGLWLGEEKRFHKEVEIWRDLQHPHVSRLYGIVYFEDHIYSVSAWMENGSALDYINSREEVINRLNILGDAASGMEYLHRRGVIHGDLRAANILIGNDGKACVADFGLSQVIEEVAPDMSSSTPTDSPVRWQAWELVKPDEHGELVSVSLPSDVWSFGMLSLELMTGKKPYHYWPRDSYVIADLVAKHLPKRPVEEAVVARGLGDALWNLMLDCWRWEPLERPPMSTVKATIRSLPQISAVFGTGHTHSHRFTWLTRTSLGNNLTESPRALPKDLPDHRPSIPVTSRTSLSPSLPVRTPPSPSPLSSTPPRTSVLGGVSRAGLGLYTSGSTSSSSSGNFSAPQGSGFGTRHRPSVSSQSTRGSLMIAMATGSSLGLRGSFAEQSPNSAITVRPSRAYSSPRLAGTRNDSIQNTSYAKDQQFLEVFLTTYRLFTSTRDVLRHMVRKYVNADSDQNMRVEDKVTARSMVLKILGHWLKGHYAKAIEPDILEDLQAFLHEITSPPTFHSSARSLIALIDNLRSADIVPRAKSPTLSHPGTKRSVRASDIKPMDLAIALTVLEGSKYKSITATDCVSYLLHKDGPPKLFETNKVAEARATNNKIVNWVKKSVIKSDRMENRGDTLRFFVNTAAECRRLHNFSSMSAVLAGIDSQTVMRLKLTRGCLDKHMREAQKKLSGLLEVTHNHRAYRDILPEPDKGLCLPWLAVHLKDLQSVYERHLRQTVIDDQSLINFEKYTHVHDSILAILAFQNNMNVASQAEGDRKAGPLLYLEEQLAMTVLGQEDKMEARSLDLQRQEDRDYEHRVNELAAVGFRTTKSRG
ncbi:ras guanine nucleotide exchange factor domain-containing protein [Phellopilus nigrolimitatus]|nr:ras guanine nucleotide exchange factor domain-containing protein [Phellopilus nigrolimitatus]